MSDIQFKGPFQQFFDKPAEEIISGLKEGRWPDAFVPVALQILRFRQEQKLDQSLHTLNQMLMFLILMLVIVGVFAVLAWTGTDNLLYEKINQLIKNYS